MMKKISSILLFVIIGFLTYVVFNYIENYSKQYNKLLINNTEVKIANNTNDSVQVYLTLGSDTNYVDNVYGIYGITVNGLQGSFFLKPHDTVSYTSPKNKGFNGNISFGTPPLNCPTNKFNNGINIFEFALNNDFNSISNPQETIDISCVAGVNCKISCYLSNNNWNAEDTSDFNYFENSYLYDNTYLLGVFPYGCDSCTKIKNPPICNNNKKFSKPKLKSICNIQRDASKKGGYIVVCFDGFLK